jgi:putative endonuclease
MRELHHGAQRDVPQVQSITAVIQRESNMKHWPRAWKAQLIVNSNPRWLDLFDTLNQ